MRIVSLRNLHLWHRWLGIVLGLLVLFWFISGLVMLYVPYPSLTQAERLVHLRPVNTQMVKFSAGELLKKQTGLKLETLKLAMLNHRPVYHLMINNHWQSIWADNGQKVLVSQELLRASVKDFDASARIENLTKIELDQWSLSTKYDGHRPLYLAELDDLLGTHLYLSSQTGEVVIDTTRQERAWNWVGAVIHWVYFTPLRVQADLWRQVILWTAFLSMLLIGIGFWLGLGRIRIEKKYKNNRITPYTGWKKWHHLIGLAGGIFCITWLLSGWLSVKPFDWISERKLTEHERLQWTGQPLNIKDMALPINIPRNPSLKEINWVNFAGNTYLLCRGVSQDWLLDKHTGRSGKPFSRSVLIQQAKRLRADHAIVSVTALQHGDLYYRASPNKIILPVLRMQFNDTNRTSYYINANTSNIVATYDDKSRLYRWFFHGLHRLDIPPLSDFELPRQLVIFALSGLGIILSLAGLIIGFRRLQRGHVYKI